MRQNHSPVRQNRSSVRQNHSSVWWNHSPVWWNHSSVRGNHSAARKNRFGAGVGRISVGICAESARRRLTPCQISGDESLVGRAGVLELEEPLFYELRLGAEGKAHEEIARVRRRIFRKQTSAGRLREMCRRYFYSSMKDVRQRNSFLARSKFMFSKARRASALTWKLTRMVFHYQKVYERGQRKHPQAWGTYFLRLVAFGKGKENQLRKIIEALATWKSRPRAAFLVHLSSTDLDNPRPLGAPCWQYAQFIRSGDDVLSLSAVYRSHDYFQKAPGNFIGLTRLLRFVCEHSKMRPGFQSTKAGKWSMYHVPIAARRSASFAALAFHRTTSPPS